MKNLLIVLNLIFIIGFTSCDNKSNKEKSFIPIISSEKVIPVDSFQYEEVRYVAAKHFTSSGLYNLHCKLCHGSDGSGDGVIARYHEEEFCPYDLSKVKKPDHEIYFVILNGSEHMPNTKKPVSKHILTNDDIWMVIVYIKQFKNKNKNE